MKLRDSLRGLPGPGSDQTVRTPENVSGEMPPSCGRHEWSRDDEPLRKLMVGYQDADPLAAKALVHRITPRLIRLLSEPGLSRGDTEDLVQECWLRIHRARHTYRPAEPVLPWICAIARHTRVDGYRRRKRRELREVHLDNLPETPASPEAAGRGWKDDVLRLVERLPPRQREVIWMLKVSGMSLDEVARATSSTVGGVKQQAHRAYNRLRRMMAVSQPGIDR